jgi:hypothetical protein
MLVDDEDEDEGSVCEVDELLEDDAASAVDDDNDTNGNEVEGAAV